jgi:sugar phosphate isomerase/epimerase
MTIVATTIVHPNPGVAWNDVQKQLKRACELARKHGAENVTVLVNMVGGQGTNAIGFLTSAQDWSTYGQIQQSLSTDPDYQGLLIDAGQIATWENYVSQTIDM